MLNVALKAPFGIDMVPLLARSEVTKILNVAMLAAELGTWFGKQT
jgi:hypothetical protein